MCGRALFPFLLDTVDDSTGRSLSQMAQQFTELRFVSLGFDLNTPVAEVPDTAPQPQLLGRSQYEQAIEHPLHSA